MKHKISKCSFICDSVKFFGHIISKDGILPDPKKIEAIKNYPQPKNIKQLQAFLGLVTWFKRFVPKLSDIAKPLYLLLSKHSTPQWNEQHESAFEKLKKAFITPPILGFPRFGDPNCTFILSTDASEYTMSAVLSQTHGKKTWVIQYASLTFTQTQAKYGTTDREVLAVFTFVEMFRPYLFGHKFVVQTDHQPLVTFFADTHASDSTNKCILCWREKMQEYQFEIQYIKGKNNGAADALSRIPPPTIMYCYLDTVEFFRIKNQPQSLMTTMKKIPQQFSNKDELDKEIASSAKYAILKREQQEKNYQFST